MEGEPEDEGDAPGDLEAPLLGESMSEDDVQEEEPTAMSQAMSSAIGHDLTPSQTRFLVTGSFIDILTNVSVSFIFPFLPTMLEDAGTGPYQRGLIFAALPFGVLLLSPLVPPLLWRVGTKCVLVSSLVLVTACLCLATYAGPPRGDMKLSDRALTRCVAIWACSRLFMGFAVAGTGVTVLCLMTRHLPRRSHVFANGVLESAIGVGYMVGPALGGWLFELFKWSEVPLIVNATATALLVPFVANMRLDETEDDVDEDEVDADGNSDSNSDVEEDKRARWACPRDCSPDHASLRRSWCFWRYPSASVSSRARFLRTCVERSRLEKVRSDPCTPASRVFTPCSPRSWVLWRRTEG